MARGSVAHYDPALYNAKYFRSRKKHRPYAVIPALTRCLAAELGPFTSALDLGAGAGYHSRALAGLGIETWAVELSKHAPVFLLDCVHTLQHDLRQPLDLGRKFDLVLCIEMAEHLPELTAGILCDTIACHCDRLIVLTAAPPGQGGTGHVNCQPSHYWRTRLETRGLYHLPIQTKRIKHKWTRICGGKFNYLVENVMIFGEKDG